MRLEYSAFVERDLEEIASYIARHNSERAATFIEQIISEFQIVLRAPLSYRLRPDIARNARVAIQGNYLILFTVRGDSVRIQRIVHGSRKLQKLYATAARDRQQDAL